jgi:hypothetical protein
MAAGALGACGIVSWYKDFSLVECWLVAVEGDEVEIIASRFRGRTWYTLSPDHDEKFCPESVDVLGYMLDLSGAGSDKVVYPRVVQMDAASDLAMRSQWEKRSSYDRIAIQKRARQLIDGGWISSCCSLSALQSGVREVVEAEVPASVVRDMIAGGFPVADVRFAVDERGGMFLSCSDSGANRTCVWLAATRKMMAWDVGINRRAIWDWSQGRIISMEYGRGIVHEGAAIIGFPQRIHIWDYSGGVSSDYCIKPPPANGRP